MARPKKNALPETVTPEVETLAEQIQETSIPTAENKEASFTAPAAPTPTPTVSSEDDIPPLEQILPEIDRSEMDRYFRVINNSTEASRISDTISHQRDLQLWGVHQYDNNKSRNTYSRSFYFKKRENALIALKYADKLLG